MRCDESDGGYDVIGRGRCIPGPFSVDETRGAVSRGNLVGLAADGACYRTICWPGKMADAVNHAQAVGGNCAALSALIKGIGSPAWREKEANQVVIVRRYSARSASSGKGQEART